MGGRFQPRGIFTAEPDHFLVEVDLKGADAQVVAWEAGDEDLKEAFRRGDNIHAKNALDIFGPQLAGEDGKREPYYKKTKIGVHATNYCAKPQALVLGAGMDIQQAKEFQRRWFARHPKIKDWHHRLAYDLAKNEGTVTNRWGYRVTFFDRPETVLPEAAAWIGQSTVAITCFKGLERLYEFYPTARPLLTVHDSILFQLPEKKRDLLIKIIKHLHVEIPFPDDPLTIPWTVKVGYRWGNLEPLQP